MPRDTASSDRYADNVLSADEPAGYDTVSTMTEPASDHQLAVTAWLSRSRQHGSVPRMVDAFEQALTALWQRSQLTLGEVTLTAIVDRVLHTASAQYSFLGSIEIGASGLSCAALRANGALDIDELAAAVELVLVEFLTVLGNLTGDILTPAMHAELSRAPGAADSDTSEDKASS
jgi:hypothetical protein